MTHHRSTGRSMGRRTYLALGLAAATGAAVADPTLAQADDDPAPGDTEIGGGEEYDRHVSPDDADVVVSTSEELEAALEVGDVTIYVADDAVIDLSARRITIPGGVTLASGRGRDGSSGALITADRRASRLFQVYEDDVRITGLRFRGHQVGYHDPDGRVWDDASLAIRAYGDCEVDNCEIYGWTHAGVGIGRHGSDPIDSAAHVHHCSFHDNMMEGLGYGVVVYRGDPLIEYNYFDRNRHSIAGGGREGCSYEARYNVQGPTNLLFGFEMHSPGGERIDIHHNTFELVERRDGRTTPAVAIRGVPSEGARVANNWFHNPTDPGDDRYRDGAAVVQYGGDVSGDGWNDVELSDNHYGPDEPEAGIGHPRGEVETAQLRVYVREEGVDDEYLEGVTVEISPHAGTAMGGYDGPYAVETAAGEEYFGSYALFEGLPVGLYDVRATHPNYEDGLYADLELDPSGRQPPIVLEPRQGRTLMISDRGEPANYAFSTTGEVEPASDGDYAIDGSSVVGRVEDGTHAFVFTGEIDFLDADAPIEILLDGEAVDPEPEVQVITFEGGSESDPTHYIFEVTERIEWSDAEGASADPGDTIAGTMAAGVLRGGRDSYAIPADDRVTGFIALGDVRVRVDGDEVPSDDLVGYFD